MPIDPISIGITAGFKALSMFGSKKNKDKPPSAAQVAARNLQTAGYREQSKFPTPGQQGRTPAAPKSAEIYDYYQMVAKAKIVIDKLDPEKGSSVGKFGTISDSSIRTA